MRHVIPIYALFGFIAWVSGYTFHDWQFYAILLATGTIAILVYWHCEDDHQEFCQEHHVRKEVYNYVAKQLRKQQAQGKDINARFRL